MTTPEKKKRFADRAEIEASNLEMATSAATATGKKTIVKFGSQSFLAEDIRAIRIDMSEHGEGYSWDVTVDTVVADTLTSITARFESEEEAESERTRLENTWCSVV